MMRQCAVLGISCGVLLLFVASTAVADELPIRKAGLWEMKIIRTGSSPLDTTVQQCTDETVDKLMSEPLAKQTCSKWDSRKTATGYVSDAVCFSAGIATTSHSEIVGDFNTFYTGTTHSHIELGDKVPPHDTTTKVEAKWLGACKEDQKPGDIMMPGGVKTNVREQVKGQVPGGK